MKKAPSLVAIVLVVVAVTVVFNVTQKDKPKTICFGDDGESALFVAEEGYPDEDPTRYTEDGYSRITGEKLRPITREECVEADKALRMGMSVSRYRATVVSRAGAAAEKECPEVPAPQKGEKVRENKSCFRIKVAEGEETGWILYPFWARSASAHPLRGEVESWLYGASEPLIVSPGKVPRLVIPVGHDGEVYKFKGIDVESVIEIRFMQEKNPFTGASVY